MNQEYGAASRHEETVNHQNNSHYRTNTHGFYSNALKMVFLQQSCFFGCEGPRGLTHTTAVSTGGTPGTGAQTNIVASETPVFINEHTRAKSSPVEETE